MSLRRAACLSLFILSSRPLRPPVPSNVEQICHLLARPLTRLRPDWQDSMWDDEWRTYLGDSESSQTAHRKAQNTHLSPPVRMDLFIAVRLSLSVCSFCCYSCLCLYCTVCVYQCWEALISASLTIASNRRHMPLLQTRLHKHKGIPKRRIPI